MTGPLGDSYSDRDEVRRLRNKFRDLRDWAKERYQAEVTLRSIENIHRETLRITWQQVIDKLEGN